MEKSKTGLKLGIASLFCFMGIRVVSFLQTARQQKIIIYNIPQKQAIDFIDGRYFVFHGDSSLLSDDLTRDFHLKPSRIIHRVSSRNSFKDLLTYGNYIVYKSRRILLMDGSALYGATEKKQTIDLAIISGNAKFNPASLPGPFDIKQIVFDASVPYWKINTWKKNCDSLCIPYHDVAAKGAFVVNLR